MDPVLLCCHNDHSKKVGATILVARQYRVFATLGIANTMFGEQRRRGAAAPQVNRRSRKRKIHWENADKIYVDFLGWLARLPLLCSRKERQKRRSEPKGYRRAVTGKETTSLILVLNFPIVFLEVFVAAYYQRGLELELSDDKTTGRIVCEENGRYWLTVSIGIICLQYLSAVYLAWLCR